MKKPLVIAFVLLGIVLALIPVSAFSLDSSLLEKHPVINPENLNLELPYVNFSEKCFSFTLNFNSESFGWQLDSDTFNICELELFDKQNQEYVLINQENLDLEISCADYLGSYYSFILNFDQSLGIGWRLEADSITPCKQDEPEKLVISVEADLITGTAPLTISFSSTVESGNPPYTYFWDFGDESDISDEQNPTHTYDIAGTYTAAVMVVDNEGQNFSKSFVIDVEGEDGNVRIVAAPGAVAAGFPAGTVYSSSLKSARMGKNGHIAFSGSVSGSPNSTDNNCPVVWAGFPNDLQVVAKENDTISGIPSNILFGGIGNEIPIVTSSGHVAFKGYLKGAVSSNASSAILAWVDGTLKNVLRLGDHAPGFSNDIVVYSLSDKMRFSDAGLLMLGMTSDLHSALWYWDYEEVKLLASSSYSAISDDQPDQGNIEQIPSPIEGYIYFFNPLLGYVDSEVLMTNLLNTLSGKGLFINDNGDIIVDLALVIPDGNSDDIISATLNLKNNNAEIIAQANNFPLNNGESSFGFSTTSLNSIGGITFQNSISSSTSSWYQSVDDKMNIVILSDPINGGEHIPPNYTDNLFYGYSITNSLGRSVVHGMVGLSISSSNVKECILAGTPRESLPYTNTSQPGNSQLNLIAETYMQPPNFSETSFFSDLGAPKLTEEGDILFTATIESATDKDSSIKTIWRVKADNAMECLLSTGQEIYVNGELKTVNDFYFDDNNTTKLMTGSGIAGLFSETGTLLLTCKFSGSNNYSIVTLSY